MGTHYGVYITDDALGRMIGPEGKALTSIQEAAMINRKLEEQGANIFTTFEYYGTPDMIFGELRKDHPSNYYWGIFRRYDNTYFRDDSRGSHLINLKEHV